VASSTYFAEGLPWSVLHQVAGEFLTAAGVDAAQIGRTSYLHAATLVKVLVGPVLDTLGSLRGWMILGQAAMGVAIGALGLLAARLVDGDPTALPIIWILLGAIGVLSAIHDTACDGYYMEVLDKDAQARWSGARVAAFRVAMLVGSAGVVVLGGRVGWRPALGAAAALMLLLAVAHQAWLPRPRGRPEPAAPRPRGTTPRFRAAFEAFLAQDRVVLVIAFLLFYKTGDVVMFAMSKVLLARELAVPTDVRGVLNSFSTIASIAGAVGGGAWIARRGLERALLPITLVMSAAVPLYALMATFAEVLAVGDPAQLRSMEDLDLAHAAPRLAIIALVVVVEQFAGGLATAGQVVFIMRRCHPDHKAAHYAFATALYSTSSMLIGGESGSVWEAMGPVPYFWLAFALTIPAVFLVRFVPKT
jgi:PAT family beta-lactamase induction signal transducer AmpG